MRTTSHYRGDVRQCWSKIQSCSYETSLLIPQRLPAPLLFCIGNSWPIHLQGGYMHIMWGSVSPQAAVLKRICKMPHPRPTWSSSDAQWGPRVFWIALNITDSPLMISDPIKTAYGFWRVCRDWQRESHWLQRLDCDGRICLGYCRKVVLNQHQVANKWT